LKKQNVIEIFIYKKKQILREKKNANPNTNLNILLLGIKND